MWLGQTDAAIELIEQAKRIDPELNAMDRFSLSLAYYLKHRYGAAIEQAALNLRDTPAAIISAGLSWRPLMPETGEVRTLPVSRR
jgi:tetratricopeptide (TPR) repeat protein